MPPILKRFNITSKTLQTVNIDLSTVITLYDSLVLYLKEFRYKFDQIEQSAKQITDETQYSSELSRRKKNIFFDEKNTEEILQGSHNMKTQTFFVIIDTMISDLTKRKIAYDKIYNQFDFLFNLGNLKSDDIEKKADHFQNIYCDDIEEDFV